MVLSVVSGRAVKRAHVARVLLAGEDSLVVPAPLLNCTGTVERHRGLHRTLIACLPAETAGGQEFRPYQAVRRVFHDSVWGGCCLFRWACLSRLNGQGWVLFVEWMRRIHRALKKDMGIGFFFKG